MRHSSFRFHQIKTCFWQFPADAQLEIKVAELLQVVSGCNSFPPSQARRNEKRNQLEEYIPHKPGSHAKTLPLKDKIAISCNIVTYKLLLCMKVREVIAYEHHFEAFLSKQPIKVQDKIFKIIEAIETLERVPSTYLKHLEGTDGLFEARIQLGSNIWRVFCFLMMEDLSFF